jgi:hypothetical protein
MKSEFSSSPYLSLFSSFVKKIKKYLRKFFKYCYQYRKTLEIVELTILYFLALVTLIFSVANNLGHAPKVIYDCVPFAKSILAFSPFKFLASPEKTLLIYFLGIELIFNRKIFSLLFKYNVLLVFILEMLENLFICYWDLFVSRDAEFFGENFIFSREGANFFFSIFFLVFYILYLYCYSSSIKGYFPKFPGPFKSVTDSIGFWFNIEIGAKKDNKKS